MLVEVEHACGHSALHECAKRWLPIYLAKKACKSCQQVADARSAANLGLPELDGSPSQVGWANSVRVKFATQATDAERSRLHQVTSAKWWIDHRDDSLESVLADIKNGAIPIREESVHDLVQSWDAVGPSTLTGHTFGTDRRGIVE